MSLIKTIRLCQNNNKKKIKNVKQLSSQPANRPSAEMSFSKDYYLSAAASFKEKMRNNMIYKDVFIYFFVLILVNETQTHAFTPQWKFHNFTLYIFFMASNCR